MQISSCRDASCRSVLKGPRCTSAPCVAHREAFFSEQVQQHQLTTWAAPCTLYIVFPVYCFSSYAGHHNRLSLIMGSREGSDTHPGTCSCCTAYFNPHSREGSDNPPPAIHSSGPYFNPHSREGSDSILPARAGPGSDFNPHSREGSDGWMQRQSPFSGFQSTLPRRE